MKYELISTNPPKLLTQKTKNKIRATMAAVVGLDSPKLDSLCFEAELIFLDGAQAETEMAYYNLTRDTGKK